MKLIFLVFLLSFNCFAYVDVRDVGAESNDVGHDYYFDLAAQQANATGEQVYVPVGIWSLTAPTIPASWFVESGAIFTAPANYQTGNDNLSYLTGITTITDYQTNSGLIVGSMDWTPYTDIRHSAIPHAMINGVSPYGTGGLAAYTRTSDKAYATEGTIGVTSYVLNDNESSPGVAYGSYTEVIKWPGAGATFGEESNLTCYGTLERVLPSGIYGNTAKICANYLIGPAVGSGPLNGIYAKSNYAVGVMFGGGSDANTSFDAGIVFTRKAFEHSTANEIIRTFTGSRIIWHGSGFNPKGAIEAVETEKGGEVWIKVWGTRGKVTYKFTEDGLILPSGKILN